MRISRHQMFMGIARVASLRSTCHRLNVGAVLVNGENNVVSIGYNGSMPNEPHCGGSPCQFFMDGACRVVHAERNAIMRSGYDMTLGPPRLSKHKLYITHSPCQACAVMIRAFEFDAVYYETEYRKKEPLDYLIMKTNTSIFRVQPSGFLLNMRTNEVTSPE